MNFHWKRLSNNIQNRIGIFQRERATQAQPGHRRVATQHAVAITAQRGNYFTQRFIAEAQNALRPGGAFIIR